MSIEIAQVDESRKKQCKKGIYVTVHARCFVSLPPSLPPSLVTSVAPIASFHFSPSSYKSTSAFQALGKSGWRVVARRRRDSASCVWGEMISKGREGGREGM